MRYTATNPSRSIRRSKTGKKLTLTSATCLLTLISAPAWSTGYLENEQHAPNLKLEFQGSSAHLGAAASYHDVPTVHPEAHPETYPAEVGHHASQNEYQHLYAQYYGRPRVRLHEVRSSVSTGYAYKHHATKSYAKPRRPLSNFWSYLGFGTGIQRFTYEDKKGKHGLNFKAAHLVAGVQYKKLFGVEARLGTGIGGNKGKFDCAPYLCQIEISSPLYAGLYGRVQYASKASITPYALLGVSYNKLTAKLSDYGGSYSETKAKYGFSYGAGLEFRASEKVRVGVEYLKHEKQLSAFSLNARYVF